jgi:hypothetical protein
MSWNSRTGRLAKWLGTGKRLGPRGGVASCERGTPVEPYNFWRRCQLELKVISRLRDAITMPNTRPERDFQKPGFEYRGTSLIRKDTLLDHHGALGIGLL